MATIRRSGLLVSVTLCLLAVGSPATALSTTVFTFDVPVDPGEFYLSPLPATFSQDGVTLEATAVTGSEPVSFFHHTNVFSLLFPHISEGALTDGFLLTQQPGHPASTLTLSFSAGIVAFAADFGVLVDFGVVADPTPASLRLEAFAGSHLLGSLIVTPTGGPSVYEGVVDFALAEGTGTFDRVVLTSLPAAFDAGSPEFIVDNVRITLIPEPSVFEVVVPAIFVLLAFGRRWTRRVAQESARGAVMSRLWSRSPGVAGRVALSSGLLP